MYFKMFPLTLTIIHPLVFALWTLKFSKTACFFFYSLIGVTCPLFSAPLLLDRLFPGVVLGTSFTMLVCYHRAAQSGITVGGEGVVTKQVAFFINVLMWHYSGLYPPPFRLHFHTGRWCEVGITLIKHSNRRYLNLSKCLFFYL